MTDTSQPNELAAILTAIQSINSRLDKIEQSTPHSALPTQPSSHPSLDKLSIAEAIADSIFGAKEKACTFEPSKPCDHCSMCNTRGF